MLYLGCYILHTYKYFLKLKISFLITFHKKNSIYCFLKKVSFIFVLELKIIKQNMD